MSGNNIIDIQTLSFLDSNNTINEDSNSNLVISSNNDIDLSANTINCLGTIDMSGNNIIDIQQISFLDSDNTINEDSNSNLNISSNNEINLDANVVNFHCAIITFGGDIDMSGNGITNINELYADTIKCSNEIILTDSSYSVIMTCDVCSNQLDINGSVSISDGPNLSSSMVDSINCLNIEGGIEFAYGNTNTILLYVDQLQNRQLDVSGQLLIGNITNTNSVILSSDTTNDNQLDVSGNLLLQNGSNSVLILADDISNNQLDISGNLLLQNGSNSVLMLADDISNNQLDISGNLVINKGPILSSIISSINYLSIYGGLALTDSSFHSVGMYVDPDINGQLDIDGVLLLGNNSNSNSYTVSLQSGTGAGKILFVDGNLQISNNSSSNTHKVEMYADNINNNQLDISGNLLLINATNGNSVLLSADDISNNQLDIDGDLDVSGNIIISGYGSYLEFPDGSQQTTAGGTGDVTSAGDNTFTGNNTFNNNDGITLENPGSSHSVTIYADDINNNQLDISGNLYVSGNITLDTTPGVSYLNLGNSVYIQTKNQLPTSPIDLLTSPIDTGMVMGWNWSNGDGETDFLSYGQAAGPIGGFSFYATNVSYPPTLLVTFDGSGNYFYNNLFLEKGSNSVQIFVDDTSNNQLDIFGSLAVFGNTTIVNASIEFTAGTSLNPTLVEIYADPTFDNQLDLNGSLNLQTTGGGSVNLSQNSSNYLVITGDSGGGIVLTNGSNSVTMYPDDISNNQLDVSGNLLVTGDIIGGTTSSSPLVFTGYNQINNLSFNNQSCGQRLVGTISTSGGNTTWTFSLDPSTYYGNGFLFAYSTNQTPVAYGESGGTLSLQPYQVISGSGNAVFQPYYIPPNTTPVYNSYLFTLISISSGNSYTPSTTTKVSGSNSAEITISINDGGDYYDNGPYPSMNLYIYPQTALVVA
jgi:hypothetical protein